MARLTLTRRRRQGAGVVVQTWPRLVRGAFCFQGRPVRCRNATVVRVSELKGGQASKSPALLNDDRDSVVLLSCTRPKAACMFSLNDKWGRSMIAIEKQVPSPAELAEIIRGLRERHEWSQAALPTRCRAPEARSAASPRSMGALWSPALSSPLHAFNLEATMAEAKPRESISTRIDAKAREVIELIAAARRTTPAQVARVLLEDAAKSPPLSSWPTLPNVQGTARTWSVG
jgi:hypothetical protein